MAVSHGSKPLKSLHTSLTVYHTYPSYPIGPAACWETRSAAVFSLKVEETPVILSDPGWLIQAQYFLKCRCSRPGVSQPLPWPITQGGRVTSSYPNSQGSNSSVPWRWIVPDPSDHPRRDVPHISHHPGTQLFYQSARRPLTWWLIMTSTKKHKVINCRNEWGVTRTESLTFKSF